MAGSPDSRPSKLSERRQRALHTYIDELEAEVERLREFVAAHDAVEHLIADHTDDRQAYNAAVERFDQAREALRDG